MSAEPYEWISRIKAVEREYQAMVFAARHTLMAVRHDSTLLRGDIRTRDMEHASGRLEATYIIRLFAEFEAGLRTFLRRSRSRQPPSRTRDLTESVAARCRIPDEQREKVHAVREYRNSLLHERAGDIAPIPIADARSHLCSFFSFLARYW